MLELPASPTSVAVAAYFAVEHDRGSATEGSMQLSKCLLIVLL